MLVARQTSRPLFHSLPAGAKSNQFLQPPRQLSSHTQSSSLSRCVKYRSSDSAPELDTFSKNSGYLFELGESESESIIEYDIAKITDFYRRKPLVLFRRLFQISTTFGRWFALRYIDGLLGRADTMFK
ncbi:hypothetical protein Dimus_024767, partial [Dionaea muscipula]